MSPADVCSEARFLADVAEHQMIIIRDDGVHRHVRFKKPGTGCMRFDLITWPGYLCYTGDMGTYVFQRLEDMFKFFRTDQEYSDGRKLAINLQYWAEKLEAVDRHGSSGSHEEFSEDKFKRAVLSHLVGWIRGRVAQTTKEERRELWDAVMSEVIDESGDSGGYRKQAAAFDFHHRVNNQVGEFYFQDFFESDLTEYTYRFVWCCYALAWGIQQYDLPRIGEPLEVSA